jgi:hypothetical protein
MVGLSVGRSTKHWLFLFDPRTMSAFSNSFAFDIISIDDVLGGILGSLAACPSVPESSHRTHGTPTGAAATLFRRRFRSALSPTRLLLPNGIDGRRPYSNKIASKIRLTGSLYLQWSGCCCGLCDAICRCLKLLLEIVCLSANIRLTKSVSKNHKGRYAMGSRLKSASLFGS